MNDVARACWPWLLAACVLAACTARTDAPEEKKMDLDPATAAYQRDGYNDRPVEARLGPHRYLIPANYFRDQIGPDFQGNFDLLVQWPGLEPLPPGKRSGQDMETFAKQITISPTYVDRVPMEDLLEKTIAAHGEVGSPEHDNPIDRLDLRDVQPVEHGLTSYRVNAERLADYQRRLAREYGHPSTIRLEEQKDWYLGRDPSGRLTTVIKCDSHLRPDGYSVQGDRLVSDGASSTAVCDHYFLMPDEKIDVSASYQRIFLGDWKRIEARARGLLTQYLAR